jgi:hypothetical protein
MIKSAPTRLAVSAMLAGWERARHRSSAPPRGSRTARPDIASRPASLSGASTNTSTSALRSAGRMRLIWSGRITRRPAASMKPAACTGDASAARAATTPVNSTKSVAAGERNGMHCPQSGREIGRPTITAAILGKPPAAQVAPLPRGLATALESAVLMPLIGGDRHAQSDD